MVKHLWAAIAFLVASDIGHASDCSPGSPMYQDAFFTICDAAREAEVDAANSAERKPNVHSGTNQPGAERNPGDRVPVPGSLALDSEEAARK